LMAIPPVVMIVPLFVLYTQLHLISTYEGAIVIYAGLITPFSVYLLVSFFRTLPRELFEAARIDGAGDLLILLKIVTDLLVLHQAAHSRALDSADVHKSVIAALVRLNKAVAFGFVEKFHCTNSH